MSDQREYATGNNPNPADIPADVSGRPPADWESRYLESRERQLEDSTWYPKIVGQPSADMPPRLRAFTPDTGDFQATISPTRWDCSLPLFVPQSGGAQGPVQAIEALPGRSSVTLINTGNNPVILSPSPDKAMAGVGITVAAGGSFSMDCQGPAWAYANGGTSTIECMWTYYESPSSHLPPKPKE